MKKRFACFVAFIAICISILGTGSALAEDRLEQFKLYYTEVTLPDSVVVLTTKTSDSSADWEVVGINSPSTAKKDFENRNVVAAFGDKNTKAMVYFISNNSSSDPSLLDTFCTLTYDNDQVVAYAKEHSQIENAEIQAEAYNHSQGNFFKLNITSDEMQEIVYGAVLNGLIIEFTMDNEIGGAGIHEDFLRQIVDNVHFTKIYTRSEYDAAVSKTWKTLGFIFGGLVLIFIGLIVIHKVHKKKQKQHAERISDQMAEFRRKFKAGEIENSKPLFVNETVYDSSIVSAFSKYTTWLKNLPAELLCALAYGLIIFYAATNGSRILLIFTIVVAVIVLYMMYSNGEKKRENLCKQLVVNQKKTAIFRFYDEYLTMSGISSIQEFIYVQITDVRIYNGYMFLYMSNEYALMLDLEGMEEEKAAVLYGMVKEKIKI